MIRLTSARHAEWVLSPGMMGHVYAKEQMDKAIEMLKKYTKTAAQKKLAKIAFADSTRWNYWCNEISDKYIAMVRYALRRVGKGKDLAVLYNIYNKHSMLKSPFLRYLEYTAAKNDYKNWLAQAVRDRSFYMPVEDATERANNYRELLTAEFA